MGVYFSVYLAGKINKHGWREKIVKEPDELGDIYDNGFADTKIDGLLTVGPFFITCDHGCYHGEQSHGVGAYDMNEINEEYGETPERCSGAGVPACAVTTICKNQIDNSNFVFAYINSITCYGTLCEIGYAIGKGIPVAVMFSTKQLRKEMWFAAEMANIVFSPGGYVLRSNVNSPHVLTKAQQIAEILSDFDSEIDQEAAFNNLSNRVKNALAKLGITNSKQLKERLKIPDMIPGIGPKGMMDLSEGFEKEVAEWESLF